MAAAVAARGRGLTAGMRHFTFAVGYNPSMGRLSPFVLDQVVLKDFVHCEPPAIDGSSSVEYYDELGCPVLADRWSEDGYKYRHDDRLYNWEQQVDSLESRMMKLRHLKGSGGGFDSRGYEGLLEELCDSENGNMHTAVGFVKELAVREYKSSGCFDASRFPLDFNCFRMLIIALVRQGSFGMAVSMFKLMTTVGFQPDRDIYESIMFALSYLGKPQEAKCLLHDMLNKSQFFPDSCLYNCVIDSLSHAGKWEQAKEMFLEMKRRGGRGDQVVPSPDAVSYSVLFHCLCDAAQWEEAKSIFYEMKIKGFLPSKYDYDLMIHLLCRAGDMEAAVCLFHEMKKNNMAPDDDLPLVLTYTSLIHGYYHLGRFEDANGIFDEMKRTGTISPDPIACITLAHSLRNCGRMEEADQVLLGWTRGRLHFELLNGTAKALREALGEPSSRHGDNKLNLFEELMTQIRRYRSPTMWADSQDHKDD